LTHIGKPLRLLLCAVSLGLGVLAAAGPLHAQPTADEFWEICAFGTGTVEALEAAIEAGVDINALNKDMTPLMTVAFFAQKGAAEKTEALLKANADFKKTNSVGDTALHHAALNVSVELMAMLIHAGADVNAVNAHGVTPLTLVCREGMGWQEERQEQAIALLLEAGVDIKAITDNSLLSCVASHNPEERAALLDANVKVKIAERPPSREEIMARAKNLVFAIRVGQAILLMALIIDPWPLW
jgi:hypothetical protein